MMYGSTKYVSRRVKEQRENQLVVAPPPLAPAPLAPRIRTDVEPNTSNQTLYGETPAPTCTTDMDPKTYCPKDWKSVTHSQYQPLPYVATSREVQIQRIRFQMSSDLPLNEESSKVFDPSVGFAGKETQFKSDFKPLEREWYVNRPVTFSIGGGGAKSIDSSVNLSKLAPKGTNPFSGQTSHSDVKISESDKVDPHQYETLTKRQFQPYPIDKDTSAADKTRRHDNKKDMVSSHFVVGTDKVQYETSAKAHLPSEKPLVKNHLVNTAPTDPEHNPYIAKDAADARPAYLTVREVAARKAMSSVPVLTRNNPEYYQYGGQLPTTSAQYATPALQPARHLGWQLGSAALGGIRLGHEDQYVHNGDGTFSPKRRQTEGDGGSTDTSLQQQGGINASGILAQPSHGRRSATPVLKDASVSTLSGSGAVDPRWVSASKASYKGFSYSK